MGVEAEATVRELRAAYTTGKTKSFEWRASQLKAIQKMLTLHSDQIIQALRSDLNKPEFEAVIHEICVVSASCKLALKELHRWMKPQKVKTALISFPSSAKIVSEPLGLVLIISAWNFPFALSLDPVVGAIAAGNAVVLKPSESAPATSSVLAKLVDKYMDTSAVKVVEGAVAQTTALLHQKWDKIIYTGGSEVGRIVLTYAAKHLTPVVLELGGKCPAVLDSNINLKVAARRIIAGKWGCNSGQACISPDYIITTKDFVSQLVNIMSVELEKFFGKEPLQSKELSSIINAHHFNRLVKLLDDGQVSGKIVCGGERDVSNLKIAPTIILDVSRDSIMMDEEIFGPILPIITVDKIEECFGVINGKEKPLAAYLFTNNKKLEEKFVANISAGGMIINDTILHFIEPGLPFGGVGESGMGAYHGKFSFDAFSHKKPVLKRSFAIDLSARYPPYTPGKRRFLSAVVQGNLLDIFRSLGSCW
ncbi:aldehyde dehydrogenase-like [Salvia splendens]|uniref:aldehyde dehydrogenase-like n=1 Tax=Salvia splendens TaxID=180675 RepID=UPI0010FFE1A2|nr:aldehyde dehydrogenase-like [Salvia splendens]